MDTQKVMAKLEYLLLTSKSLWASTKSLWSSAKSLWASAKDLWSSLTKREKEWCAAIVICTVYVCCAIAVMIYNLNVVPERETGGDWMQYAKDHDPETWHRVPDIFKSREDTLKGLEK